VREVSVWVTALCVCVCVLFPSTRGGLRCRDRFSLMNSVAFVRDRVRQGVALLLFFFGSHHFSL
jgi:hypothetical protein